MQKESAKWTQQKSTSPAAAVGVAVDVVFVFPLAVDIIIAACVVNVAVYVSRFSSVSLTHSSRKRGERERELTCTQIQVLNEEERATHREKERDTLWLSKAAVLAVKSERARGGETCVLLVFRSSHHFPARKSIEWPARMQERMYSLLSHSSLGYFIHVIASPSLL